MKKAQIVSRMFSSVNESFTASQIRDPRLISMFERDKLKAVRSAIDSLPIWIDDTARISLDKLKARARVMIRQHRVKLIGVDYLQLIKANGRQADQMIEEATFGLRDLAKEENVHVIALCQYSRDSSPRGKGKTGRQRLKGSSAIEQSAQNIFLIEADEPKDGEDEVDAQIAIDKQREGGRKKDQTSPEPEALDIQAGRDGVPRSRLKTSFQNNTLSETIYARRKLMITTDIDFAPIAAQVRQVEDIVDQVKQWDAECVDADKAGKKASMRLGWYGYKIKQANRFGVLGCGTEDDYWELRGFKRSTWYRATAIASQFQNIPTRQVHEHDA